MFKRLLAHALAIAILVSSGAVGYCCDPEADATTARIACEYKEGLANTAKNSAFDAEQSAWGNHDTAWTMYAVGNPPFNNLPAARGFLDDGDFWYDAAVSWQGDGDSLFAEGEMGTTDAQIDFGMGLFVSAKNKWNAARAKFETAKTKYDSAKDDFDFADGDYDEAMSLMNSPPE